MEKQKIVSREEREIKRSSEKELQKPAAEGDRECQMWGWGSGP